MNSTTNGTDVNSRNGFCVVEAYLLRKSLGGENLHLQGAVYIGLEFVEWVKRATS